MLEIIIRTVLKSELLGSTKMSKIIILGAIEADNSKKTKWVKYCETPCTLPILWKQVYKNSFYISNPTRAQKDWSIYVLVQNIFTWFTVFKVFLNCSVIEDDICRKHVCNFGTWVCLGCLEIYLFTLNFFLVSFCVSFITLSITRNMLCFIEKIVLQNTRI